MSRFANEDKGFVGAKPRQLSVNYKRNLIYKIGQGKNGKRLKRLQLLKKNGTMSFCQLDICLLAILSKCPYYKMQIDQTASSGSHCSLVIKSDK
jgi:hypothetical protein